MFAAASAAVSACLGLASPATGMERSTGPSSCEFRGNIRDGKVPYGDRSGERTSVGIALEYELRESANDLELLAVFELDNEDGY